MNIQALRLAGIVLLIAAGPAFAAKPHYEITGKVVAIADGDTLTVLDGSNEQHKHSPRRDRRAGEGPGFRDKGARESRRQGLPADGPRRGDRRRPLPPRSGPDLTSVIASSTWRWSVTASPGGTCNTTSQGNSPQRKPMPASIGADYGLIRIRLRRGNGGRPNGERWRRTEPLFIERSHELWAAIHQGPAGDFDPTGQ